MSLPSRREYVQAMRGRYAKAKTRKERGHLLDELVEVAGFDRKHAIKLMRQPRKPPEKKPRRKRAKKYLEAMPVIARVWEALDYCCAERLHPQLLPVAEILHRHGEIHLTPEIRSQLSRISRTTLGRRLGCMPRCTPRKVVKAPRPGTAVQQAVPIDRYAWNETRPGALELDLVEHNGGSSLGHFAYTLTVTDVVTGWSRRAAVLGRSQKVVFGALTDILASWPYAVWAIHSDNGSEFLHNHLVHFAQKQDLYFSRSRPYYKNDNAHVEQKNRQFVREIVGYARYDTPEQVQWLNQVYQLLDPYANFFLPMMKVIEKTRQGAKVRKHYDTARPPLQRLADTRTLAESQLAALLQQAHTLNPLALHRQLEARVADTPQPSPVAERDGRGKDSATPPVTVNGPPNGRFAPPLAPAVAAITLSPAAP